MTPREINEKLIASAEKTCAYLLPGGRKQGGEFMAASTSGGSGDSLRVRLAGTKAGVWKDFSTGESGADLLDLWVATRKVPLATAMVEAKTWLGLADASEFSERHKTFKKPERPKNIKKPVAVAEYLRSRGLTDETMAAFKIAETADKNGGPIIAFPFKRGEDLLFLKYLAVDRPEGKKKTYVVPDCQPILFGWQALDPNARELTLTEGEIDAMSLHQLGIHALSVPNGASGHSWVEHEYPNLDRFDTINLMFDSDEPGRKGALTLIDRLGRYRCRLVTIPHKDANSALMAGATAQDFAKWIADAKSPDPDELKSALYFSDRVVQEFYPTNSLVLGTPTPWKKIGDKLLFRPGETSLYCGYNGSGKSLLLGYIALHAMHLGRRVAIASMEMRAEKTLARMVRQATGLQLPTEDYIRAVQDWFGDYLWIFDVVGSAKVDRLFSTMDYARRRYGVSHFIIDSLAKCALNEEDLGSQKAFVEQLTDFARDTAVHCHLIVHPRKSTDEFVIPSKMDIRGSAALTDLVDNVVIIWRNKLKERDLEDAKREGLNMEKVDEIAAKPDLLFRLEKQRNGSWEGPIALWYDPATGQYRGAQHEKRRRYISYRAAVQDDPEIEDVENHE